MQRCLTPKKHLLLQTLDTNYPRSRFAFFGDEIRFRVKGFLEKLESNDVFRVVPTRVARLGLRPAE